MARSARSAREVRMVNQAKRAERARIRNILLGLRGHARKNQAHFRDGNPSPEDIEHSIRFDVVARWLTNLDEMIQNTRRTGY